MARPIAYDPSKLRQDLMTLFWAKGYAETSLADLEAATGLNRRQLYNTIGDKRQMFLQAMDDFTEMSVQLLLAPLERDEAGLTDIEILFAKFVEMSNDPVGSRGCMVCSSSQDEIAADAGVSPRINAFFDRIRSAHLNVLNRAADRGEIELNATEVEQHADALFGAHVALCILRRAGRPEAELQQIATQALAPMN